MSGDVDAERFIMLMNRGTGDYTEWRRTHLYQNISLEDLTEAARKTGHWLRHCRRKGRDALRHGLGGASRPGEPRIASGWL